MNELRKHTSEGNKSLKESSEGVCYTTLEEGYRFLCDFCDFKMIYKWFSGNCTWIIQVYPSVKWVQDAVGVSKIGHANEKSIYVN